MQVSQNSYKISFYSLKNGDEVMGKAHMSAWGSFKVYVQVCVRIRGLQFANPLKNVSSRR